MKSTLKVLNETQLDHVRRFEINGILTINSSYLLMGANCNMTLFITEATGGLEISISMQFKISKIATISLIWKNGKV